MNHKTYSRIFTILIPVILFLLYLLHDDILKAMSYLPPCTFNSFYHAYCPACGNTRSVTALLHGEILASLRFNIIPVILSILLLLSYIELAAYNFGKQIRLLPRALSFYITLLILIFLYLIIRNFIPYLTP